MLTRNYLQREGLELRRGVQNEERRLDSPASESKMSHIQEEGIREKLKECRFIGLKI